MTQQSGVDNYEAPYFITFPVSVNFEKETKLVNALWMTLCDI
jgi:hypothetical protein